MTKWPHNDSTVIGKLQIYNIILVLRVACRKLVASWNYYLSNFRVFFFFSCKYYVQFIVYKVKVL